MNEPRIKADQLDELRRQAEAKLKLQPEPDVELWGDGIARTVQELRTHQIELEMQNEELRQTQEDLIESNDQYTDLYDSAPVGYLTVRSDGVVLLLNVTLAEMLGTSRSAVIDQPLSTFVCVDDQDICYLHQVKLGETGEAQSCQLRLRKMDGLLFWVSLESTVVKFPSSGDVQIRMAVTDISDLKKVEKELATERDLLEQHVETRTNQLRSANGQLRDMLDMYERDRKLLAYELHDGLVQLLPAVKMYLEAQLPAIEERCEDKTAIGFHQAMGILDDCMTEGRRLLAWQRPAILDQFGPVAAIDNLVMEFRQSSETEIEFMHNVKFDRLAPALETALFRVVQEALSNIRRHAQSDRASVTLTQRGDRVCVEIRDWGVGFDPENVEQDHYGLEGIRQRGQLFGGTTKVESSDDKGTSISVEFPLSDQIVEP